MLIQRLPRHLRNVACAFVLACLGSAASAGEPVHLDIVSGTAWRAVGTAPPSNWTSPDFNDSGWSRAYAPFPNPGTTPALIANGPTKAQLMWFWDKPTLPTATSGPDNAWFRYTFMLELSPSQLPIIAQALIIADDDFELFVNGRRYPFVGPTVLSANRRANNQPRPLLADFTNMLRNGKNVLAIHATNLILYKWMFVDAKIRSVMTHCGSGYQQNGGPCADAAQADAAEPVQ